MAADPQRYPIPAALHRHATLVERSRFVCTLGPAATAEEAQRIRRATASEMPDADHHCWAFVAGAPGTTRHVGANDDGEPRGTAGRPMLTVLLHSGVGEIVAVVTRYFGGVKLGTGGLVRAYSGAVQGALASLPRRERVAVAEFVLTVAYSHVTIVQQLFASFEVQKLSQAFDDAVRYRVQLPLHHVDALTAALKDATRGVAQLLPPP